MSDREFLGAPIRRARPGEIITPRQRHPFRCFGPPVQAWILSSCLETVVVHWTGERTQPCFAVDDKTRCVGCEVGWAAKCQSWLMVQPYNDRCQALPCPLTPHAVGKCPLLEELEFALHGRLLRLHREPASPRGRLFAELVRDASGMGLVEAEHIYTVLTRMWGAPLRRVRFTPQCLDDLIERDRDPRTPRKGGEA